MILLAINVPTIQWAIGQSALDRRVDSLISLMTLEEKIGQMNQYNGFWDVTGPAPAEGNASQKYENLRKGFVGSMLNITGVEEVRKVQKIAVEETRLGIPLIIGFDMIHGMKTMSPIPLAEAASWDLDAIEKSSQIGSREAAAMGVNWTFAPMVDVSRDARWGRVMEGAGEDPYLSSQIAKARVKGYQGDDLSDPLTLAACVKHFAGYGFSEGGRDYNTVDVGTSTLYNVILPPFKAALDAGARTFMNSFNDLNGIPATGNSLLQREILKGKWGFKGFIVSDWGSIGEMVNHRVAQDGRAAAKLAIQAGSDMDMESYLYIKHLKELIESGEVEESLIDDAVRRILSLKFELGLFDDPYLYCDETREEVVVGSAEHISGVLEMAKKSIVLLKNKENLLPLAKSGLKVAIIGSLASDKDSPLGSWRGLAEPNSAVSVLEGLENFSQNNYTFAKGAELVTEPPTFLKEVKLNTTDRSGFSQALEAASAADVVIAVMGEHGFQSGEARSRSEIGFPGLQQELLEELIKVNKKVILVSISGRPLDLSWADQNIPAILQAWQLGSQSGNAIAQVLFGDYNPSGKLPMSFPRNVGQMPLYYNQKSTGRPNNPGDDIVFWSHYSDVSNEALYPFGFGLSYTQFDYSGLSVESLANQQVRVKVNLKNSGLRDGEEVAQLYLNDHFSSFTRPIKELKGFQKIHLKSGESKTIEFFLGPEDLGFYDGEGNLLVEPGEFTIMVGGNSSPTLSVNFLLK
ncbi:beta-glucosidase [Algoriphagus boritolerans DSM 17298 = JCM 18970]|uniref:beta-glucosidase n=2 Tax=Algoriphagus TaxID=246875 RepID=A0A1H5S8C0_9BACT|nr:beta-glucosidase [Algoriphagus boritolerans DSM 17298 = JCM 18970]